MCCSGKCWLIAGSIIGALLAILGGVLIPVGDIIIKDQIDTEAVIEEGTIAYDNWIVPGSPVYRQFWIFNVSNPDEIINGGKPKLQQQGPYTYLVRHLPKTNVTQNNNSTVTYYLPNNAIFQRHMSIGSDDDKYTVLNLGVAAAPALLPNILLGLVDTAVKRSNSSLFQIRSVHEVLWGYKDPFLEQLPIAEKTTGVFYPYNGTYDGPYVVFNGKDDISKVNKITKYKGESTLSYWKDDYCDMINGTDAASFPPFVNNKVPLYFFSSEICRSIFGDFEKEHKLRGIKVNRFVVPKRAFASPVENPDNHCYCRDIDISRNCTAAGVLDLRPCQGGKPIFLSSPHFLDASKEILDTLEGLSPNQHEHETFVDVEPTTGFTMHFAKRLQVNVYFNKTSKIEILSKLQSEFIFPVVWLNETAMIGEDSANIFKSSVTTPLTALGIVQILLLCLGCVIFLACSITLIVRSCGGK
ncbi:platelet glycoprotein 4 [Bufo gargarizans]|uniref:platelet glycoprotein 4 n=1 Tax=Bufo gargarizans TaxID=30331 RepID=UPI001CF2D42F|nr:platelet glycoprotein 4 [Bufo gargarizans]